MTTGQQIVDLARTRIGQRYVFGAKARYDDATYAGPWDCAEFATWAVRCAGGPLFGVSGRSSNRPDAYSGAWISDARSQPGARVISIDDAARTPGAILVRAPGDGSPVGHVALSAGDGSTIEAMSPTHGVAVGRVHGRRWTLAVLPPGIDYATQTTTPAPTRTAIAPALAVTLWASGGLTEALDKGGREILRALQPDAIQLHTSAATVSLAGSRLAAIATEARALCPQSRLWLGLGVDSWANPEHSTTRVLNAATEAARWCNANGIEHVVWNAEEAWKGSTPDERAHENTLARRIVDAVAAAVPTLVQGHSAYDHPNSHSGYAWRGWVGPGTPVQIAWPQVYAAPAKGVAPHQRGAGERRLATALASWDKSVDKGVLEGADDLEWRPYVQAHSVHYGDTTNLLTHCEHAAAWAIPTRTDGHGLLALAIAQSQRRAGLVGPDATERLQAACGVPVDGKLGPRTLASAMGLRPELRDTLRALRAIEHPACADLDRLLNTI